MHTHDLKNLILIIETHRQTIGNSQYGFEPNSEERDVVARFASNHDLLLRTAQRRIEKLFWEAVPRIESNSESYEKEMIGDYIWSIVRPLRRDETCTEENYQERFTSLQQSFTERLFSFQEKLHPQAFGRVWARANNAFFQEHEKLALFYKQQREIDEQEQ